MQQGAGGPVRVEEVRLLQSQMEQMRERLDFISPMLPLVNFCQDYFQKVECEASVQLTRLKQAQVVSEEDQVNNAQLEFVRWLHFVTDAVILLHKGGATERGSFLTSSSATKAPTSVAGTGLSSVSSRLQAQATSSPHVPVRCEVVGSTSCGSASSPLAATVNPPRHGRTVSDQAAASPFGSLSLGASTTSQPTSPVPASHVPEAHSFLRRQPQRQQERSSSRSGGGLGQPPRYPGVSSNTNSPGSQVATPHVQPISPHLSNVEPRRDATGTLSPRTSYVTPKAFEATFDHQEPGTGGTGSAEASDLDGLTLGRGSWANAYRQAHGPRREALRLLYRSSIVTARELSDDLTVISQEHIDECVQIASEMLRTWSMDMWIRQPDEAKKFFEAKLTVLYQSRFEGAKP